MAMMGPAAQSGAVAQRIAMVNQQAAQIQSSAQGFKAAAGTGFHITPEAAATLVNGCRHSIDLVDVAIRRMADASQMPKLGQTPVAVVVAPFTQHVATDTQGMMQALQTLKITLQDMVQAYYQASTNYHETESIVTQSMQAQHVALPSPATPSPRGTSPQVRNRAV